MTIGREGKKAQIKKEGSKNFVVAGFDCCGASYLQNTLCFLAGMNYSWVYKAK